MGLLAEAKERQKQKLSRQFISFYDSVLYLGEPKDEALEFVISNLRNEQTHLRLEYGELYLINIQRYQDDPDEYNYFTDDFISDHLTECVKAGYIDESNPIYNLGFAKKSFIEMLVCFGLPVSENEQKTVQSPDLAFNDEYFEIDYYTYEMVVNERNELRERLENSQPNNSELVQQVADLKNQLPNAENNIAILQADTQVLIDENNELKAKLEQQAGEPAQSDTPADGEPLFDELDPRTQNNFIRLLLAVNEMAKDKQGQSLDYGRDYNKENLQAVNAKLDLLSYDNIGETAFKTLATLIREKQAKGL